MLGQAVGRDQETIAEHTPDIIGSADGGATIKGDYMMNTWFTS